MTVNSLRRCLLVLILAFVATFVLTPVAVSAAEAQSQDYEARKKAQEESLKKLENRAKELAKNGFPKKTAEEREKESKPIISEDCVIEVVTCGSDSPDDTTTTVFTVTERRVTCKLKLEGHPGGARDGAKWTKTDCTATFEGTIQDNVITGKWLWKWSPKEYWNWNSKGELMQHLRDTFSHWGEQRIELHVDNTLSWNITNSAWRHDFEVFVGNPIPPQTGNVKPLSGHGVWQFRSNATTEETPPEPTVVSDDTKPRPAPKPNLDSLVKVKVTPPHSEQEPTLATETQEAVGRPDSKVPEDKRFYKLSPERQLFYKKYGLYMHFGEPWVYNKIMDWLLDENLPMKEIEVRAWLAVFTAEEYREFYWYVASKGIDNYADGKLWQQAAKVHPVAKSISLIKDLASAPYDIVVGLYEYKEAKAAERVLTEFEKSYGLKTPTEVDEQLRAVADVLKEKKMKYRQLELKLARGYERVKSGKEPETPLEREEAARWNPDRIKGDMEKLSAEINDFDYKRKALSLRLKALTGNWKEVIVKWAR